MPKKPAKNPPDAFSKKLGENLAKARKAQSLDLDAAAAKLGVSRGTVGHWETGQRHIDALKVQKLADLYETSAGALYGEVPLSPQAVKMAAQFDSLSDKDKAEILAGWDRLMNMLIRPNTTQDADLVNRTKVNDEPHSRGGIVKPRRAA